MKHLLSLSLLILTTCTISSMNRKYSLPIEATITKKLWDEGFSNFAQHSKMGKKLNEASIDPITLWSRIDDMLKKYILNYAHIINTWDHTSKESYPPKVPTRTQLIYIVLQDYPRAIEALENNHWIERREKTVGVYVPKMVGSYIPTSWDR